MHTCLGGRGARGGGGAAGTVASGASRSPPGRAQTGLAHGAHRVPEFWLKLLDDYGEAPRHVVENVCDAIDDCAGRHSSVSMLASAGASGVARPGRGRKLGLRTVAEPEVLFGRQHPGLLVHRLRSMWAQSANAQARRRSGQRRMLEIPPSLSEGMAERADRSGRLRGHPCWPDQARAAATAAAGAFRGLPPFLGTRSQPEVPLRGLSLIPSGRATTSARAPHIKSPLFDTAHGEQRRRGGVAGGKPECCSRRVCGLAECWRPRRPPPASWA